jgi:hypothetical protein
MRGARVLCGVIPLLCLLSACSDSIPAITGTRLIPVFDFSSPESRGAPHVCLLVQVSSDIGFAGSLRLTHLSTGYVWNIGNPLILEAPGEAWAASPRLSPAGAASGFSEGEYRASYIDTAGRNAESSLTLQYPQALRTAEGRSVRAAMPAGSIEKIAVYDGEDNLLYYGERASRLQNDAALRQAYPAAVFYRECLCAPDNGAICILPPAYRPQESPDGQ